MAGEVFDLQGGLNPVLIGQRVDFDMIDATCQRLTFTQDALLSDIDSMVRKSQHRRHGPYGMDTFTFSREHPPFNTDLIPPFLMERVT